MSLSWQQPPPPSPLPGLNLLILPPFLPSTTSHRLLQHQSCSSSSPGQEPSRVATFVVHLPARPRLLSRRPTLKPTQNDRVDRREVTHTQNAVGSTLQICSRQTLAGAFSAASEERKGAQRWTGCWWLHTSFIMEAKFDWKATFPGKPDDVISKNQLIRDRFS